MRRLKAVCTALFVLGLMASPLLGHHSVTKKFDQTRATNTEGVITKLEWMNPHAWITLKAKGAKEALTT